MVNFGVTFFHFLSAPRWVGWEKRIIYVDKIKKQRWIDAVNQKE